MASISDITQGASYRGEAALGGALGVGVVLDTAPLQRLATFTYYRDRDMWEKKNADDKLAADKIAAITGFDITSPLKPFSEDLKNELASIQSYVRDNPDALVYGRNPQKFQELSNKINQFANKRKGATANDVLYNAQKSAIEKISDPQTKELRRRELDVKVDRLFGEGLERAYNTQIDALPDLKPSDYEIPTAAITSRSFIDVDPNSNTEITVEYVDMDDLISKSEITAASPAETVNVEGLSPEEQQIEREKANLGGSKRRGLQKIASEFNPLLEQWQAANPNIDINTVDPKDLPSGTISDIVRSIKSVNNQIDEVNGYIARGKIVDKGGFVKQNPYGKINIADGLTEAEVVMMKSIQANGNSLIKKVDKQIQQTDNAIQLEKIRADKALGWANLNWDKDKFKLQTQGSEEVKNGATIFAERIYNELKSIADENGIITPSKLRRLTNEQRKYLGYDKEDIDKKTGTVIRGLKPIELTPQDETNKKKGVDAIQLVNGQIKVLKNARLTPDGKYWEGLFDETRTTTVSNIATNRLNEQLAKAGTKELNSYLPLDQGNIEVQSTTSGGGTTMSGSSSTGGGLSKKAGDWKKEGDNWRYKDGTLYDENGNVIK